jgi:endonuclease/exonuclease/phosphatase family metal-dependent hydrolase
VDEIGIRLVTYNVHSWSDANQDESKKVILQTLRQLNADVVCLNEATHGHDIVGGSPLTWLAKQLNMTAAFSDANWTGFGNAILCRSFIQPLLDHHICY